MHVCMHSYTFLHKKETAHSYIQDLKDLTGRVHSLNVCAVDLKCLNEVVHHSYTFLHVKGALGLNVCVLTTCVFLYQKHEGTARSQS